MSAKSKVPAAIRALTILIPILTVVQLPIAAYLVIGGLMENGMKHNPFGLVTVLAGVSNLACLVFLLVSISALRRGEQPARRTTTLCIILVFAFTIWGLIIIAPAFSGPAAVPWEFWGPLLLLPIAILLLLWVGASVRQHFTAAGPQTPTSPAGTGEDLSAGTTDNEKAVTDE
ncbi:hypothetical protein [Microbacterium sp. NPDC056052]|uniref:hypothetical protein n=1 Tax=Microbacterium sp. NPDC056052 TaxID=3345695 RepID=UPI0035D9B7F4